MKKKSTLVVLGLALLLAVASGIAGLLYAQAGGTSLSITFGTPSIVCNTDASGATVTLPYTVISTAAADAATVTGQIDDNTPFNLQTINSGCSGDGAWTCGGGSTKTAEGSYATTLSNGTYTFTVTATQSGSEGNEGKTTTNYETVVVDCTSTSPCANTTVFGNLVGNPSLCNAKGAIPIHWQGDFGDSATILIEGPNAFSKTVDASHSGESCNYQALWDPRNGNNGGKGTYTFTITGDNLKNDSTSAVLKDCAPGK